MTEQHTKDFLYNIALGIIDLIDENERLQRENANLTAYKEQRVKMDAQHLQRQIDTFNDIASKLSAKQYRIWFKHKDGLVTEKTNEVFSDSLDACNRCFWLNDNSPMSAFGQYIYEEEEDEECHAR